MELTRRQTISTIGITAVAGCSTRATDDPQNQSQTYLVIESGETHAVSGEETYAGIEWEETGGLHMESASGLVLTE